MVEIGRLALEPARMTATATSPFGLMASPSGPSPTTTRSMIRGGCASRSMTLVVSTLPSEAPALPLSAVKAILPPGATSTLYGHSPAGRSSLLGHLVACHVEQRDLVPGKFRGQRALAIGCEHDV